MNTKTLALVGLLLVGLMAVPAASAQATADEARDQCIGIYEEDAQGNEKCTGVWSSSLTDPLCPFMLRVCEE